VDIISRAEWGARPPTEDTGTVSWSQRVGLAIHHSAGPTNQTVRAIQDYYIDVNRWGDIGYNFLVDQQGRLYEGRGWMAIGAHALNLNSSWLGVCWIGDSRYVQPTDAALAGIRWVYDEACRRAGRRLQYQAHGRLPGQSTECPGPKLRAWIDAGMPSQAATPEEEDDDMDTERPSRDIPVSGIGSFNIPPTESGTADPRPQWVNVCNDTTGVEYWLRIWMCDGQENFWRLPGTDANGWVKLRSGRVLSAQLPKGIRLVSMMRPRKAAIDGVDPKDEDPYPKYMGHLTWCLERGKRLG